MEGFLTVSHNLQEKEKQKKLAKTRNVSAYSQKDLFLLFHRLDSVGRVFVQCGPHKVEKYTSCSQKKNHFSQLFFARFSAANNFRQPKIFGAVNINRLRLLNHVKTPLDQKVFKETASKFTDAVGRLPAFKMFLQKQII